MRFHAIDFTKSLAIVMIVTCHYLMFSRIFGLSGVGRFLATLSSLLFLPSYLDYVTSRKEQVPLRPSLS